MALDMEYRITQSVCKLESSRLDRFTFRGHQFAEFNQDHDRYRIIDRPKRAKGKNNMNTLDQALSAVTASEAKLSADRANLVNVQTAIDTATTPLAAAQSTVKDDIAAYNASIDDAITALQAAKITV